MPENGFEGFTYQKSYNNMMSPQTLHYNLENSKNFVIAPADADEWQWEVKDCVYSFVMCWCFWDRQAEDEM